MWRAASCGDVRREETIEREATCGGKKQSRGRQRGREETIERAATWAASHTARPSPLPGTTFKLQVYSNFRRAETIPESRLLVDSARAVKFKGTLIMAPG